MAETVFRSETPVEFFKAEVEAALERQRVRTSEWTAFYLVQLLAGYVSISRPAGLTADEPLGVRLARSLQAEGQRRREGLREVGDASLFLAGFFADSLNRRLVDIDYYVSLGGFAYSRLAAADSEAFSEVFGEMAEKFVPLVDVLSDISERAALSTNRDLLRLYERWLKTGSARNGALLAQQGIVPQAGSTRLQ